jgi:uncharacterized protein YggE
VVVTSSIVAATTKDASEQVTKAHERVKSQVASLKLKDAEMETLNYSIMEECHYDDNKRVCKGFRASYSTAFETSEISRIGEIIAIGAANSSEQVSQMQTFVSRAKLRSEQESCLEIAARDAASKVQKLAAGAGIKVGRLLSVIEQTDGDTNRPVMSRVAYEALGASAVSSVPSIDSKPIDLEVRVRATYAVE